MSTILSWTNRALLALTMGVVSHLGLQAYPNDSQATGTDTAIQQALKSIDTHCRYSEETADHINCLKGANDLGQELRVSFNQQLEQAPFQSRPYILSYVIDLHCALANASVNDVIAKKTPPSNVSSYLDSCFAHIISATLGNQFSGASNIKGSADLVEQSYLGAAEVQNARNMAQYTNG